MHVRLIHIQIFSKILIVLNNIALSTPDLSHAGTIAFFGRCTSLLDRMVFSFVKKMFSFTIWEVDIR